MCSLLLIENNGNVHQMDFKDYYGMPRGKKRMSFHRTVSLALLIPINQGLFKNEQTPVVPKVDSAIHWIALLVIVILIHWMVIYPVG